MIKHASHTQDSDFDPIYKLSTLSELEQWYKEYPDLVKLRSKSQGYLEKDYINSNLKLIQDLAFCDFATKNLKDGAKILEIGGGSSRILTYFKDRFEGWNLDKFEGVGNGPTKIPAGLPYKVVPNYLGAFDERLPDGYFDMVFSISVLEHVNEPDETLKNILDDIDRLLKPGGFNVHCMDCRFPSGKKPDMSNRPLIKYLIEQSGFSPQYVYDNFENPDVFAMSGLAYDRFWKKACRDRPHELDGLPFNIFLALKKGQKGSAAVPKETPCTPAETATAPTPKPAPKPAVMTSAPLETLSERYPWADTTGIDSYFFSLDGGGRDLIVDEIKKNSVKVLVEIGSFLCGSSLQWFEGSGDVVVIGIDPWTIDAAKFLERYNTNPTFNSCFKRIPDRAKFIKSVKDNGVYLSALANVKSYKNRFIPMRGFSPDVLYELVDLNIVPGMVYIDSNKVMDDLEVCAKLFPNAILCGDDWTWGADQGFPVKTAVTEFCTKNGYNVRAVAASWVIDK